MYDFRIVLIVIIECPQKRQELKERKKPGFKGKSLQQFFVDPRCVML